MTHKPFVLFPKCSTCLSTEVNLELKSDVFSNSHLRCTCKRCGNAWTMETAETLEAVGVERAEFSATDSISAEADILRSELTMAGEVVYLYGLPLNPSDVDMMLLAAYYKGRQDMAKELIGNRCA